MKRDKSLELIKKREKFIELIKKEKDNPILSETMRTELKRLETFYAEQDKEPRCLSTP